MTEPIDPRGALESMWRDGPLYAKAKAERVQLEEYRKSLKAILMKKCGLDSIGAQEREAYADAAYRDHLKALEIAVEQEETLRWRLVTSQLAVEVWRTQESSNRAMVKGAA